LVSFFSNLPQKERAEEVSQRIVQYRRGVQQPAACGDGPPPDGLRPAA